MTPLRRADMTDKQYDDLVQTLADKVTPGNDTLIKSIDVITEYTREKGIRYSHTTWQNLRWDVYARAKEDAS